jgi:hypothetical protein
MMRPAFAPAGNVKQGIEGVCRAMTAKPTAIEKSPFYNSRYTGTAPSEPVQNENDAIFLHTSGKCSIYTTVVSVSIGSAGTQTFLQDYTTMKKCMAQD